MEQIISQELIEKFLNGEDPEKYIVNIEYDYVDNVVYKTIQDPDKGLFFRKDTFIPFLWTTDISDLNFYNGDRESIRRKKKEHGIIIEKLQTFDNERLENGLKFLVKTTKSYSNLVNFFKQGGIDPWGDKYKKYFIVLSPVEQYLIQKKKRLFKGFDNYSDVHRLMFDIETTGLDKEKDKIILIGMKDNRGFLTVIDTNGEDGEKRCIETFFKHIKEIKPSIIGGHNSAEFDFPFILKRADILGVDITTITDIFGAGPIKMKEGVLKLASEIEPYNQYIMWGMNIIDTSHAVRRAQAINSEIKSWGLKYITKYIGKEKPNRVYIDGSKISKTHNDDENYYINPKTGNFRRFGDPGTENLLTKFPGKYEVWSGKKIVEQYLDDDLYETLCVDESFSQATFLLSKLVPTSYQRVSTMGTATLWKLIMLAWSYENNLSIPEKKDKRPITGGLSRLLKVGYSKDIVKFDFKSLYPTIDIKFDVFPDCDVMGVQKALLKYFLSLRFVYRDLKDKYSKTDKTLSELYDRKQLPLKIFINAFFGSLSAPLIYPWGDMDYGETTTCIGRQTLRMMVMFFVKRNYIPLVMDTDGVNFSVPNDIESKIYIGKGKSDAVIDGKEYKGIEADLAEFNDIFMRDEMGLDIDYIAESCINVSRKNYIIRKSGGKIKLTGNTIKSKKLQQYVVEFLDEGLVYLLDGNGFAFIELYYSYIEKIFNKQIPLSKIANKSRVKQSVDDYKKYIKKVNKAGSLMARQAHMELVLQSEYPATLGETIYYVNNGTKKSHGDVQKDPKTKEVNINCYMIPEKDIMYNPDMTGDYNVPRYISIFNKKVEPLLVVYHPDIRNDILVENPENRMFFTKSQCELCSGYPLKEGGQDNYNEVMTLSESEVSFWHRVDRDPFLMYPEGTLDFVDKYWVDFNKRVMEHEEDSIKNNEDEEILELEDEYYGIFL